MHFCTKCGKELEDGVSVCPNCGNVCEAETVQPAAAAVKKSGGGLATAIKVFMVLGCLSVAWSIIPLIWAIPMTVVTFRKLNNGEPIGVGFKICSLLFVSLIGGILMLCHND